MIMNSNVMKILVRHYGDQYFEIMNVYKNNIGVMYYNLKVYNDNKTAFRIAKCKIMYDHQDKILYGAVVEIEN